MATLVLSEEQELLRDTAREFVKERSPVASLRALRDKKDATGFDRKLWKEMAELGWAGIIFPEEYGGSELGYAELGVVLEECGRTLTAQPVLSTVLLGGNAVRLAGSEQQKKDLLTGVCAGDTVLALAFEEQARFAPYQVATRAEAADGGYRLSGEKTFVLDGHVADQLIVAGRTSGAPGDREGITLFVVPAGAGGVSITRTIMVDSRNAAKVTLDGVQVERQAVLGEPDHGAEVLDPLLDRATIGLTAEMLGGTVEAYERTIEYLKTREQFGTVIGSFQALKHRAAQMFVEVELSRSVVLEALRAVDEERADVPFLASAAKARLSDTAILVGCEAVQMFGGIGMTDEEEIGLVLKRARAASLTFGDAAWHRDRFARLRGF
jgi:alkylation response protein AidB-like acyl-CoA dehydrogenase